MDKDYKIKNPYYYNFIYNIINFLSVCFILYINFRIII